MNLVQLAREWRDMVPHLRTLSRLAHHADRIVEFGVRGGVSTWAMLDALKPDGELVSIDIVDVRPDLPRRITDDRRWSFFCSDSAEVGLPKADLFFIDSSHEYHHTLRELERASEQDAKVIALHDWNLPDVQDAVRGFCDRSAWRIRQIEPSDWGLAVLG